MFLLSQRRYYTLICLLSPFVLPILMQFIVFPNYIRFDLICIYVILKWLQFRVTWILQSCSKFQFNSRCNPFYMYVLFRTNRITFAYVHVAFNLRPVLDHAWIARRKCKFDISYRLIDPIEKTISIKQILPLQLSIDIYSRLDAMNLPLFTIWKCYLFYLNCVINKNIDSILLH